MAVIMHRLAAPNTEELLNQEECDKSGQEKPRKFAPRPHSFYRFG
jgi:hypothetical protein